MRTLRLMRRITASAQRDSNTRGSAFSIRCAAPVRFADGFAIFRQPFARNSACTPDCQEELQGRAAGG
jgi:hypothetical protein